MRSVQIEFQFDDRPDIQRSFIGVEKGTGNYLLYLYANTITISNILEFKLRSCVTIVECLSNFNNWCDCLLPVDFRLESWSVIDWEREVKEREDLIMTRIRRLDQKVLTEIQAAENLRNSRKAK